jgi:hypothetical protein
MMNSKDLLARLLANEKLNIVRANAHTASFDIVSRTLTLPVWKNMSPTLEDMLISHEVGHALFTDQSYLKTENYKTLHGYLNVIEDVRIEKMMKRRYPGLRKTFTDAYKELNDRDFFEIRNEDLSELLLIDRINLYYKCGASCGVKFTAKEMQFVLRAEQCDTIKDVQALAKEIYDFSFEEIQKKKEQKFKHLGMSSEELKEALENLASEEMEFDYNAQAEEDEEGEDNTSSMLEYDPYNEQEAQDDSSKLQEKEGLISAPSQNRFDSTPEESELESKTERALKVRLNQLADDKTHFQRFTPEYFSNITADQIVVGYKEIIKYVTLDASDPTNYRADNFFQKSKKEGLKFRESTNKIVGYLLKEFEMRKSADQYKRTTFSKSGALNVNKLAVYKLTDDIFKRFSVVKDGKNHGMIMLLDWSGSMDRVLKDTLKQTITLAQFCKRAQIPFAVYAFTDCFYQDHTDSYRVRPYSPDGFTGFEVNNVRLLELFSSKMSQSEMNAMIDNCVGGFHNISARFSLGSTPLNESLLYMVNIVGKFKQENAVEKLSFITLTDGEGSSLFGNQHQQIQSHKTLYEPEYKRVVVANTLFDPMTKKEYKLTPESNNHTNVLLRVIKDRWDATVIGFYLTGNSKRDHLCFIRNNVESSDSNPMNDHFLADEIKTQIRTNGFASLKNCGRDEMYVVGTSSMRIEDEQLADIDELASTRQISKVFTKYMSGQRTNRVLLNRFVNLIA